MKQNKTKQQQQQHKKKNRIFDQCVMALVVANNH